MAALPPFQSLLDHHALDIHRFLRGLVGRDAAEDCLQEALLSALRAYPNLRHADNLRSWLFTIAYRKGLDHLRKSARETLTAAVPETPVNDTFPADPALWRRVGKLPDKQRAAVMLRFVGDLPYAAIADVIGCSEPAARQNVRVGLATLRKEMT